MSRAVRFDNYGGLERLEVREVDDPSPTGTQVRVAVVAAGLNPGEIGIREGRMAERYPAAFPSGQGSDFAGIVAAIGEDATEFSVGDEVIGGSDERSAQAEFVNLDQSRLVPKPVGVGWEQAASLYVAGLTAIACVDAVGVGEGDTVVVAGAAGGVGVLTVQLADLAGARVIATASRSNHENLRALGAEPVEYGDGVADRIRAAAPDGVDAFLDVHGGGNVDLALELDVPKERVNTIIDFEAASRTGVKTEGQASIEDVQGALRRLAGLVADGKLQVPVYATYPLDEVREAYDRLAEGHGFGKIVLTVRPTP